MSLARGFSLRQPPVDRSREVEFRYTTPGGGIVEVPRILRPYQVLQVDQNASKGDFKAAFAAVANSRRRQKRVMASLSYNILMCKIQRYRMKSRDSYEVIDRTDVFVLAAIGDTASLLAQLNRNPSLATCTDEHNHTLLYLTARAGFYDTTEALLKFGALSVNEQQVDGSTALHAASFYGQHFIVELLLRYGADPMIKNKWGSTAADEAASTEIKQVMLSYKEDRVSQITSSLIGKGLAYRVRFIKRNGVVIGREVLRHYDVVDQRTRRALDYMTSNWINVWHGTRAKYIESILRVGLQSSGSKLPDGSILQPPSGHYRLGETHFGIPNWANAIFVSPSIAYASHIAYSERIFSGEDRQQWCILIRAYVKPNTYNMYHPTAYQYDPIDGEPVNTEYRIEASEEDEVFRVEAARNVVVKSVVFISASFLENTPNLTFLELKSLFETN